MTQKGKHDIRESNALEEARSGRGGGPQLTQLTQTGQIGPDLQEAHVVMEACTSCSLLPSLGETESKIIR